VQKCAKYSTCGTHVFYVLGEGGVWGHATQDSNNNRGLATKYVFVLEPLPPFLTNTLFIASCDPHSFAAPAQYYFILCVVL